MTPRERQSSGPPKPRLGPFRHAVLRGLAILLPPLLTIVIFLWVGTTVSEYLLVPLENAVRWVLVETADIRTAGEFPSGSVSDGTVTVELDGEAYRRTPDRLFVPEHVYDEVERGLGRTPMPPTAVEVYTRYINLKWLQRRVVVPVFLCLFVLVLYLLGKFMAAGVGRFFWVRIELLIHRVPLVRNVYSSVKQVTDFLFTEPEMDYTRVVAVEYPRKGIWSLGMVTGESMLDIRSAANEPVLSVLIPTSPMPFTGFTITVKRSETIDLNITVDQAFQFIFSCGVVVPPQQIAEAMSRQIASPEGEPLALSATVGSDD